MNTHLIISIENAYDDAIAPVHWTCEISSPQDLAILNKLLIQSIPFRVCTEIFGGYEVMTVTGSLQGQPVSREFRRRNGCEIDDYDTLFSLLQA